MAVETVWIALGILPNIFATMKSYVSQMGIAILFFIFLAAPFICLSILLFPLPVIGMFAVWNCARNAKRYGDKEGKEGRKIRLLNIAAPLLVLLAIVLFLIFMLQVFNIIH